MGKSFQSALGHFFRARKQTTYGLNSAFCRIVPQFFSRIEESVSENIPFAKAKVMPYPSYSITDKRHVGDLIAALDETSIFGMAIAIPVYRDRR